MGCTTLLVGRLATNDGSTIVARNDDSENGTFTAKHMIVVKPSEQPRTYTSVIGRLTIELPDNPLRYTCVPNVDLSRGVWGEEGINAANVSMSATETITSNPRVLAADPLVERRPARGVKGKPGYVPEKPGGIGEEDMVTIVLPYIKTAREGVERLGALLEKYGTYEMNGIAFGDCDEVWYMETIGGHHWIARRVPDDCYVAQPNRQGIDTFDLSDAMGEQREHMCSADLAEWMDANHLCMEMEDTGAFKGTVVQGFLRRQECLNDEGPDEVCGSTVFNARIAFGSATWIDTVYNTPRKWYIHRRLNPSSPDFVGPNPKYGPHSYDIPWAMRPQDKISVFDVKNLLSSTYEGTEFDCYGTLGTPEEKTVYRPVGINRTCDCGILNIRPYAPYAARGVQWLSLGSGPFNTSLSILANVDSLPSYLDTGERVTPDSLYWANRLIAALADPEYADNYQDILSYQETTMALGYESLKRADEAVAESGKRSGRAVSSILERANQELVEAVKEQTDGLLAKVLKTRSLHMKNAFYLNDN